MILSHCEQITVVAALSVFSAEAWSGDGGDSKTHTARNKSACSDHICFSSAAVGALDLVELTFFSSSKHGCRMSGGGSVSWMASLINVSEASLDLWVSHLEVELNLANVRSADRSERVRA